MRSGATSPLIELLLMLELFVCTQAGPMPNMNSIFLEISHGFLNKRSASHSVECRANSGVSPASTSSHFLMGVTSIATDGP